MIKRLLFMLIFLFVAQFSFPFSAAAQSPQVPVKPQESFAKAEVIEILEKGEKEIQGKTYPYQKLQLQILDGTEKGKTITLTYGEVVTLRQEQTVDQGQTVVLRKAVTPEQTTYQVIDTYRLDPLYLIIAFFILLVLVVGRWKGLGSLIGLGISLLVIVNFIVPTILSGQDPLITSIVGSLFIMITTMYLAHGFSQKTHIALLATCISLLLTGILAYLFVNLTFLTGLGSEDASSLRFGATGALNFQGLLLGGIIIGALGVLDDITTSLTASIEELSKANNKLEFRELWERGMRIGSEHIASLVNTLALAYAGAALPLFLFIVLNPASQPLWLLLNSEMIVEEVIRTLAGSIGLILAMPITALFASLAFQKKTK